MSHFCAQRKWCEPTMSRGCTLGNFQWAVPLGLRTPSPAATRGPGQRCRLQLWTDTEGTQLPLEKTRRGPLGTLAWGVNCRRSVLQVLLPAWPALTPFRPKRKSPFTSGQPLPSWLRSFCCGSCTIPSRPRPLQTGTCLILKSRLWCKLWFNSVYRWGNQSREWWK